MMLLRLLVQLTSQCMSQNTPGAEDTSKAPERRFGCLFYACVFLLVIGTGLTVWYRLWHSSASSELKAEMDGIRARGEPLWFSELVPPPIDPDQDGTQLLLSALSKFQKPPAAFLARLNPDPPEPQTPPGNYVEF